MVINEKINPGEMKHLENAGNEKENLWYFCDQETSALNILGSNLLECGVITNKRWECAPPPRVYGGLLCMKRSIVNLSDQ